MADRHIIKRVVVKVGTSILSDARGRLDPSQLSRLVRQLADCVADGRQVVFVSSGAIACGMARLGVARRPKAVAELQACAAIGQGELMHRYSEAFGRHRLMVAQVLLTQADLSDQQRCANAKNTLETLLSRGAVPIINENDVVAIEEIAFGDNDRLAALVAGVVRADMLIILSDVDGVLDHGRVIDRIDRIDSRHQALALGSSKETTTGGMASKLSAARIARHSGIPMVIANGRQPKVLRDILQGQPVGTLIAPPERAMKFRKWWLAFAMRKPLGSVVIDAGAAEALRRGGRSLLPSGITAVRGRFHAGDPIAIINDADDEIARGVASFSSSELARIRGLRSQAIADALGRRAPAEAVHRDQLVVTEELE